MLDPQKKSDPPWWYRAASWVFDVIGNLFSPYGKK
jgi:hypothetical protein